MAVITDLMQTYDQSGNETDYAMGVHIISPVDTPLQLILPKVQVFSFPTIGWTEDELAGQVSAVAATITATAVTLAITAGDAADKFPNDVATFNTMILVDAEYMNVTALSGSNTLIVTRGFASSATAAHNVDAVVHILAQNETEGVDSKKATARARQPKSNYVQAFSRTVEVTEEQEKTLKYGGVSSELQNQIDRRKRELANELEKAIILNPAGSAGAGSTPSRMTGLAGFISTNLTSDSGSIDKAALEADFRTIWDAGGTPRAILTTGKLAQDIAGLYDSRIRTDVINTVGGHAIKTLLDPLMESPVPIIPTRHMPAGQYMILDTGRISLNWFIAFYEKEEYVTGGKRKYLIKGNYSLELHNEEAHARRYGFS